VKRLRLPLSTPAAPSLSRGNILQDAPPRTAASKVPNTGKTETYTHFTQPTGTHLLYAPLAGWFLVRLILENAGPVSVGTKQELQPVLNGAGVLLPTGIERRITIGAGDRLYIAATAINRVSVIIEPFAWLEQIYRKGE
jgi:hypothetical protein